MKATCRLFILLAMSVGMLTGCDLDTHFREGDLKYEYDTEWAAAYYYGSSSDAGVAQYRLTLVVGRTDDNNDLTSYGSKASLVLGAPVQPDVELPEGLYCESGDYTLNCGADPAGPDNGECSYVEVIPMGSDTPVRYPVEGGSLEVEIGPDGDYEIKAVLKASGCEFGYEYEGQLATYDLSGMQLL